MSLQVIGAGLGRTGTMSLKFALEALGFGRCYHMIELFPDPKAPALWLRALDGDLSALDEVLAGFGATTDWPGCTFYRELAERHPDAKVILSLREPGAWYESCRATIFSDETAGRLGEGDLGELIHREIYNLFGDTSDRDRCIAAFERHNAEVRATIPPERLLVYEVSEGWEPLCRFLGRPVPDQPFPRANSTEEFVNRRRPAVEEMLKGHGAA